MSQSHRSEEGDRAVRFASRTAVLCVGAAALLSGPGAQAERHREEWFRSPVSGVTYRIERDAETRTKRLVSPDGAAFATTAAILAAESARLTPLERVLAPDLLALTADPDRRDEPVDVTFIFRSQPAHDAGLAARARANPLLRAQFARQRPILDRIAPLRTLPGGRAPDVAAAMREESALLTDDEKATLRSVRDEVRRILDGLRREVLAETSKAVAADQAHLAAYLGDLPGAIDRGGSVMLNARSARVPASALRDVAERFPEVMRIDRVGLAEGQLDVATQTIGAGSWWSAGYTGSSSSRIALLDSGVDTSHPALSGVVTSSTVVHTTASGASTYSDNSSSSDDFAGHGTRAAGILCSSDSTYKGIVYGGRILNAKAGFLDSSTGRAAMYADDGRNAADWAFRNGATTLTLTYAGSGSYSGTTEWPLFFDAASFSLGIPVSVSTRNDGTVGYPGDAFNCLTCGCYDDNNSTGHSDDSIAASTSVTSGVGPTADGRQKPDLCGPGIGITCAEYNWEGSNADFSTSIDGTSNVPPLVVGLYTMLQDYGAAAYPAGLRALLLTTGDQTSPYGGPDNTWGYGALDAGAAYTYRNSVFEGELTSSGPRYVLVRGGSLSSGGRATLVWSRHVTSAGASTPTTYYGIQDLDLYVYDASDGSSLGSSASTVDPTEQVAVSAAVSSPIYKVHRAAGTFTSSYSTEPFAVAAESTGSASEVAPPAIACTFAQEIPAAIAGSTNMTVEVEVANSGDVSAFAPSLTLTLPSGYTIVSGSNPQTIADVAGADTGTATWVVRSSSGPSGTGTISVDATSSSFGESIDAATITATQTVDVDPPSATVQIAGGAAYATSRGVTVSLQASDTHTSVAQMRVRFSGDSWGAWTGPATSLDVTLPAGDGTKTFEAQFTDAVGNQTSTISDSIVLDTAPPSGSLVVASDASYVNTQSVTLTLAATDATSGLVSMRFSNDGASWNGWTDYATTSPWTLAPGDGTRTVYAEFADAAGLVSQAVSDQIVVETGAPVGSVVVEGGAAWTTSRDVTLTLSATDAVSGVGAMRFSNDGSSWSAWEPYATSAPWTLATNDGQRTVHAQFRDVAGNVSSPVTDGIGLDSHGPTGTFSIEGGAAYASSTTVTLTPSVYDFWNGVADMRFSDDGTTWGAWTAYSNSTSWTLAPGDGARTVYAEIRDGIGNVTAFQDDILVDTTPPEGTVTILGGRSATNAALVTLDLAWSDATSPVTGVRLSNDGSAWSAWYAAQGGMLWTLETGDGTHAVYAEYRDAAGNVSEPTSDTILLDTSPPAGSFVLLHDAPYVLPWEALAADTTADDGAGGSGVAEFRTSTDGGTTWSAWAPIPPDGHVAVDGPLTARDATVSILGQFRDLAGNVSETVMDDAFVLRDEPPDVALVSSFTGTVGLATDRDALHLGLVAGDKLTLKLKTKALVKKADVSVALDLYGPDGTRLVDGRYPATSRKGGISRFAAPATGDYLVVVSATGTAADSGVSYTLKILNAPGKGTRTPKGAASPEGDPSPAATITFDAAEGLVLGGTLAGPLTDPPTLRAPDGTTVQVSFAAGGKKAKKIVALPLSGGTGTYTLTVPATGDVTYKLKLSNGKRTKADETAMPAK